MEDILEAIDSTIEILNIVSQVFREYPDGRGDLDSENDLWQTFVASMDFWRFFLGILRPWLAYSRILTYR